MLTYEYSPKFDDIKTVLILLCIDIALFYIKSNYIKDILEFICRNINDD